LARIQTTQSLAETLGVLRSNDAPITAVSATGLLHAGLGQWAAKFDSIRLIDPFDGASGAIVPSTGVTIQDFTSGVEIVNFLLRNQSIRERLIEGGEGTLLVQEANGTTHEIARNLGQRLAVTPQKAWHEALRAEAVAEAVKKLKIAAAITVVPECDSYDTYRQFCRAAGLTFSSAVVRADDTCLERPVEITHRDDWETHERRLRGQRLVVMPTLSGASIVAPAVVLAKGVAVAPLQVSQHSSLLGAPLWRMSSTPAALEDSDGKAMTSATRKIGEALAVSGFTGGFSAIFARGSDQGEYRLVRVIPKLSPAFILANHVTTTHGGLPLGSLELMNVIDPSAVVDVPALQKRWQDFDSWSVAAIRHEGKDTEMITRAPQSGLYALDGGNEARFIRPSTDPRDAVAANEGFFVRIQESGMYRRHGMLLGVLYLRQNLADSDLKPLPALQNWTNAMHRLYSGLVITGSSLPQSMTAPSLRDLL
jgi:hypothetical protein